MVGTRMGIQRQLRAVDGFTFGLYESLPEGSPKGAVVVIQEIFGVNNHIREVVDSYAAEGYAALAPQIFDRAQRDVELGYEAEDMQAGVKLAFEDTTREETLKDLEAMINEASKYGSVGLVGYCYGGLMTWLSACEFDGLACASAYYGGGIVGEKDSKPKCPVIMHFGELDAHIPLSDVDAIRSAQPETPVYVYAADHGFNCDHRSSFNSESAEIARERTLKFFSENIGA